MLKSLDATVRYIGKRLVPRSLHERARARYGRAAYWLGDYRDRLKLAMSTSLGRKSFLKWYAQRLDNEAVSLDGEMLKWTKTAYATTGDVDLDLLKSFGLLPHHRVHEFGAGYLRSASVIIDYLNAGRFSGNDISAERFRFGLDHFGRDRLEAKRPRLFTTTDNSFDWLDGEKVDYFWCNAVIAHMPPEDVEEFFANIGKLMSGETIALVTYSELDHRRFRKEEGEWNGIPGEVLRFSVAHEGQQYAKFTVKDFFYSFDWLQELGKKNGLIVTDESGRLPKVDTISYQRWDMLIKIVRADKALS